MSRKDKKSLEELKSKLEEVKKLYEDCSSLYSIKNELVEVTDKRYALAQTLNKELERFESKSNILLKDLRAELNRTSTQTNELLEIKGEIQQFKESIVEVREVLDDVNEDGNTYRDELMQLISKESVEDVADSVNKVHNFYNEIYEVGEDGKIVFQETQKAYSKINEYYKQLVERPDENTLSKKEELNNYFRELKIAHEKIVSGYDVVDEDNGKTIKVEAFFDEIENIKNELIDFHKKIFGDVSGSGLDKVLENRLSELKKIEREAKRVIDLSSDAGLAGGFSLRGGKARNNKFISLSVFIIVLATLGLINFYSVESSSFSFKSISELLDPNLLVTKLFLSAPFVWMAIVANVNLNKYSRLEEEYAHKESLAKSFERYKEQIQKVSRGQDSKELMLRLLKANIAAFEKNAASTMDRAKADSFFSNFRERKSGEQISSD